MRSLNASALNSVAAANSVSPSVALSTRISDLAHLAEDDFLAAAAESGVSFGFITAPSQRSSFAKKSEQEAPRDSSHSRLASRQAKRAANEESVATQKIAMEASQDRQNGFVAASVPVGMAMEPPKAPIAAKLSPRSSQGALQLRQPLAAAAPPPLTAAQGSDLSVSPPSAQGLGRKTSHSVSRQASMKNGSDSDKEKELERVKRPRPSTGSASGGGEGGSSDAEDGEGGDKKGTSLVKGYAAGNIEGRGKFGKTTVVAAPTDTLMPTISPGSPLDLALQAHVRKKKRLHRPHKPDALKILQQGQEEFERRKAAKAWGKIINKEHTFYHLSYGMMLGIYTSVVHSTNSTGWVGTGVFSMARPPSMGPGSAMVPRSRSESTSGPGRERSNSTVARNTTLAAAAMAAQAALVAHATANMDTLAVPRKLRLEDFMAVRKLDFATDGSSLTPPHALPRAFKFKDYAPDVFHSLRQRFNIDPQHYLQSLGGAYEYIEFASNSKSGSFFFYSHDGKFMIKTQNKTESKFLRRILAHYHAYVMENPYTYITRFYGLHRIKMPHIRRKIHFVVMQSVFHGDNDIHEMYDLKGSTVGRAATKAERACGPSGCVYKDMDMVERGSTLRLGPGRREAFIAQLAKDCAFLESLGIMDYSLLLGVHHRSEANTAAGHVLLGQTGGKGQDAEDGSSEGGSEEEGEAEDEVAAPVGSPNRDAAMLQLPSHTVPSIRSTGPAPSVLRHGGEEEAPASPIVSTRGPVEGGGVGAEPEGDGEGHGDGYDSSASGGLADASAPASDAEGGGGEQERRRRSLRRNRSRHRSTDPALQPPTDENLLGIVHLPNGCVAPPAPTEAAGGGVAGMAPDGTVNDDIYYLGIIDILQQYDARKMGETILKSLVHPVAGISSVSPAFYAKRFVEFMKAHTA